MNRGHPYQYRQSTRCDTMATTRVDLRSISFPAASRMLKRAPEVVMGVLAHLMANLTDPEAAAKLMVEVQVRERSSTRICRVLLTIALVLLALRCKHDRSSERVTALAPSPFRSRPCSPRCGTRTRAARQTRPRRWPPSCAWHRRRTRWLGRWGRCPKPCLTSS